MIAFTQARINYVNHALCQGKWFVSSNILKKIKNKKRTLISFYCHYFNIYLTSIHLCDIRQISLPLREVIVWVEHISVFSDNLVTIYLTIICIGWSLSKSFLVGWQLGHLRRFSTPVGSRLFLLQSPMSHCVLSSQPLRSSSMYFLASLFSSCLLGSNVKQVLQCGRDLFLKYVRSISTSSSIRLFLYCLVGIVCVALH